MSSTSSSSSLPSFKDMDREASSLLSSSFMSGNRWRADVKVKGRREQLSFSPSTSEGGSITVDAQMRFSLVPSLVCKAAMTTREVKKLSAAVDYKGHHFEAAADPREMYRWLSTTTDAVGGLIRHGCCASPTPRLTVGDAACSSLAAAPCSSSLLAGIMSTLPVAVSKSAFAFSHQRRWQRFALNNAVSGQHADVQCTYRVSRWLTVGSAARLSYPALLEGLKVGSSSPAPPATSATRSPPCALTAEVCARALLVDPRPANNFTRVVGFAVVSRNGRSGVASVYTTFALPAPRAPVGPPDGTAASPLSLLSSLANTLHAAVPLFLLNRRVQLMAEVCCDFAHLRAAGGGPAVALSPPPSSSSSSSRKSSPSPPYTVAVAAETECFFIKGNTLRARMDRSGRVALCYVYRQGKGSSAAFTLNDSGKVGMCFNFVDDGGR